MVELTLSLSLWASQLGIKNQQESLCLAYCIYYYGDSHGGAGSAIRQDPIFSAPTSRVLFFSFVYLLCVQALVLLSIVLDSLLLYRTDFVTYFLRSFCLSLREQAPLVICLQEMDQFRGFTSRFKITSCLLEQHRWNRNSTRV